MSKWDDIHAYYTERMPALLAAPSYRWAIDPHEWEFSGHIAMTPIETALWSDIRDEGMVMYPQFPVGRFFVDFANPVAKVAIECDGEEFHRDALRDIRRQREIEALGWSVYRITGRNCIRDTEDQTDPHTGADVLVMSASRNLMRFICERHAVALSRGRAA